MNQSRDITFHVNETAVNGYFTALAKPSAGVMVLHAGWGVTPFF